jgi:hypothetical protein
MNDTEEAARRLFAVAAEDVPPGIDLLAGVRARSRRRVVRIRALVAAGAAGIVAAATAIILAAGPAPSAFAQVMHAAARMGATSYQVRATQTVENIGGLRSPAWSTAYGEFDLKHGVGELTDNVGDQALYVGGTTYVFLNDLLRQFYENQGVAIPAGVSWEKIPDTPLQPGVGVNPGELTLLGSAPGVFLTLVDPQDLLALLQSATKVSVAGQASGPGWTGTAYAFTIATHMDGPLNTALGLNGTVDVDQQGRVRQLDGLDTFANTVTKVQITFGGFGLPVSVSPPPASQTWTPPAG